MWLMKVWAMHCFSISLPTNPVHPVSTIFMVVVDCENGKVRWEQDGEIDCTCLDEGHAAFAQKQDADGMTSTQVRPSARKNVGRPSRLLPDASAPIRIELRGKWSGSPTLQPRQQRLRSCVEDFKMQDWNDSLAVYGFVVEHFCH